MELYGEKKSPKLLIAEINIEVNGVTECFLANRMAHKIYYYLKLLLIKNLKNENSAQK